MICTLTPSPYRNNFIFEELGPYLWGTDEEEKWLTFGGVFPSTSMTFARP